MSARISPRSFIGFVAIAALAACAGPKTYPIGCEGPATSTPTLISPANGATGVPDGNFPLTLSSAVPTIFLTAPGGVSVPLNSPGTANAAQGGVSYAVPALQAATMYSVVVDISRFGGCGGVRELTVGTFTTQ